MIDFENVKLKLENAKPQRNLRRLLLIILTICLVTTGIALASFTLTGTIHWTITTPTDTFSIMGIWINGTIYPGGQNPTPPNIFDINLGSVPRGSTEVLIFLVGNSANQPITVTGSCTVTGATQEWSSPIYVGIQDYGNLTLTLSNITADGSCSVAFTASP